jgi:hypothetical protein
VLCYKGFLLDAAFQILSLDSLVLPTFIDLFLGSNSWGALFFHEKPGKNFF